MRLARRVGVEAQVQLLLSSLPRMACFLPSPGILQCLWALPNTASQISEVFHLFFFSFFYLRAGKVWGIWRVASGWQVWWPLGTKPLWQGIILSVLCEPSFIQREHENKIKFDCSAPCLYHWGAVLLSVAWWMLVLCHPNPLMDTWWPAIFSTVLSGLGNTEFEQLYGTGQ